RARATPDGPPGLVGPTRAERAPMSVVMKFGGTSVADPDAIGRLIAIVRQQMERDGQPPVVVVSALAKVTDALVAIAQLAEEGAAERAAGGLMALLDRHVQVAAAGTTARRGAVVAAGRRGVDEVIGAVPPRAGPRARAPRAA